MKDLWLSRARRLQIGPLLVLTLVWVLLWGKVSAMTVVGGLFIGALVLLLFPLPPVSLGLRIRPWPLFVLFMRFNVDLVRASIQVAYAAVAPWEHPQGRLVPVSLRSSDDLFTVITAEMTALVPGTIVVNLQPDERRMLLHVFDCPDDAEVERVRRSVLAQEARVLKALAADHRAIIAQPEPVHQAAPPVVGKEQA